MSADKAPGARVPACSVAPFVISPDDCVQIRPIWRLFGRRARPHMPVHRTVGVQLGRTTPKGRSDAGTTLRLRTRPVPLAPRELDGHRQRERPLMILPKIRDPRFVTIRRGGTLTDSDHHLLALWAASCAEHVLHLFESAQPDDPRPREAIGHARAWVRGEVTMMQARAAGGHAMGAARNLRGQHGMPRTLLARPGPSHTSPRTNSVRPPMRSRPHVLPYPKARARPQGDLSANGSVTSSRRPFASSCLTTSVCGTTSAGQRLTAERAWGSAPANVRMCRRG